MPLIQKIESDARDAAAQLLAGARDKAKALVLASDQSIAALNEQTARRIAADSLDQERRMQRMGELEDRKALLQDKRAVMEEAFLESLQWLNKMPAQEARAFFLARMVSAAHGEEQVKAGTLGGVDQDLVDQANRQLSAQGKPGRLSLSKDRVPGFGFALTRGGIEVVCTFERLVHDARMNLETEVASILFA